MVERRQVQRTRVLKAAKIILNSHASVIDCTVRNLSTTGAAIEVTSQTGVPEKFVLVVPGDALHLACHIVWRKAYRIGVRFD